MNEQHAMHSDTMGGREFKSSRDVSIIKNTPLLVTVGLFDSYGLCFALSFKCAARGVRFKLKIGGGEIDKTFPYGTIGVRNQEITDIGGKRVYVCAQRPR